MKTKDQGSPCLLFQRVRTRMCVRTRVCVCVCVRMYACMHAACMVYMHACMHRCMYVCLCMHRCIYVGREPRGIRAITKPGCLVQQLTNLLCEYMHSYIHAYMHTYIHTRTHTQSQGLLSYVHNHHRAFFFFLKKFAPCLLQSVQPQVCLPPPLPRCHHPRQPLQGVRACGPRLAEIPCFMLHIRCRKVISVYNIIRYMKSRYNH
jgi:hypothetical protein